MLVVGVLYFTSLGIEGVAIATTFSNIMKNYYLYRVIKKNIKIRTNFTEMIRVLSILSLTGFFTIFLGYSMSNIVLRLVMPCFVGVIVFLISWRIFQPFNKFEREILNRLIGNLPTKFNIISKLLVLNS